MSTLCIQGIARAALRSCILPVFIFPLLCLQRYAVGNTVIHREVL